MSAAAMVTLMLAGVLIAALAFFLIWIALTLVRADRDLSQTASLLHGLVRHTEPLNDALGAVARALRGAAARLDESARRTSVEAAEKP